MSSNFGFTIEQISSMPIPVLNEYLDSLKKPEDRVLSGEELRARAARRRARRIARGELKVPE